MSPYSQRPLYLSSSCVCVHIFSLSLLSFFFYAVLYLIYPISMLLLLFLHTSFPLTPHSPGVCVSFVFLYINMIPNRLIEIIIFVITSSDMCHSFSPFVFNFYYINTRSPATPCEKAMMRRYEDIRTA